MAKHLRHEKTEPKPRSDYRVYNSLTAYYLIAMFSFFPLFLTNQYASARHDKYYLFLALTALFAVSAMIAYAIGRGEDRRSGIHSSFFSPMSATDIAFLCFFVFAVISTILSPYAVETLNADSARNNGLILLAAYTLVYFLVSRLYISRNYVLAVYLIFSCIVALLTVINFFYIDPIGIFEGYPEDVVVDFGSTIGNKNTIAAFMALFLPAAMMTLVLSDSRGMRILGALSMILAGTAAVCANSGSAILGLAVAIPVMGIFAARRYEYLQRYFLGMAILCGSMKLLRLFSLLMNDHDKGFEFIQQFMIHSPLAWIGLSIFAVLWLVMTLGRGRLADRYPRRALTVVFIVIAAAVPLAAIIGILYFTLIDKTAALGSFDRLLRFDDRWGTHRGFMWIRSIEEYGRMNIFRKLFGAGPDMAIKVLADHFAELAERFGDGYTDTAHNEYINYLITQGALGLLSYLMILGSVSVRVIRRARENPLPLIFISAIVCYAVQATVNLYTPIVTPIFILFIAMAEAGNRRS
jgi:hypothetical protein